MKRKIKVGLLFGGRSSEHEVSLVTARNVYEALDKDKYDVELIGIDKKGGWHLTTPSQLRLASQTVATAILPAFSDSVQVAPSAEKSLVSTNTQEEIGQLDVVFPLLHGPYGEDGTVQGLLKLMGIPFVGADVLGSAVGMDKDVMKRLLRDAGIPIAKFFVFQKKDEANISFSSIIRELGLPFFVKPANAGSSIGVSKVKLEEDFRKAINEAFIHDRKILIEEGISAREIECSVLGNEEKIASVAGEIFPTHEFYDYEAKYIDDNGARLEIPAQISPEKIKEIQELAIRACEVLCIDGMARVDFFLDKETDEIYLNEVNTIPGFTSISMYPKLWEASGLSYSELINRLIQLALERQNSQQ